MPCIVAAKLALLNLMDRLDRVGAIAVFGISFLFYLFTLAPTVLWGDSAKLALYVYNFYIPFALSGKMSSLLR
jgi:hypothetical protein